MNTGTAPSVTYPYSDASSLTNGVEVVLHQQQNSWFASLFSLANVDIANRAVARVSTLPPGCMLALNPTANDAINLAGNPTINAPDCTLVSDFNSASAFHLQGNSDHQRGRGGHPRRLVAHWRCLYPDIEKSRADRRKLRSRPCMRAR